MSKCQKLTEEECNKLEECIFTKGKRKYCRTKKNKTSTTKSSTTKSSTLKSSTPKSSTPKSFTPKISTTPSIHNEPEYISIQYYSLKKKPIAAFDIDYTIIKTKSGKVFPKNKDDWELLYDNTKEVLTKLNKTYNIVFFTNQKRLKKLEKRQDYIDKVHNIIKELDIPINVFISTTDGYYRKPFTGLWKKYINKQNKKSFYCGDAAGRADDFAATDLMFANNIGIPFFVPEQIFKESKEKIAYNWPDYLTKYIGKQKPLTKLHNIVKKEKIVLLMCGYPGCGKSSIAKQFDGTILSNDIQGSKSKVSKKFKECIEKENQTIIIDNVNHTKKNRDEFISIAKKHTYKTMIIYIDNHIDFCYYMNQLRTETSDGEKELIPKIAYYTIHKRFEPPEKKECDYFIQLSNKVKEYDYMFPPIK